MYKEINKIVGARLRELRLNKDVKENELAQLLHINNSTYSRIERGEISLTKDKAERLANYYSLDLHEIYPYQEQINMQDSNHNNPTSGNINSMLVPKELLENMSEIIKQNSQLLAQFMQQQNGAKPIE